MSFLGTILAVLIAFSLVFLSSRNLMFTGLLFEMERHRPWVRALRTALYLSAKAALNHAVRVGPRYVSAVSAFAYQETVLSGISASLSLPQLLA
jgi:ABC-type phosphate/phosphonate transport system permease subunit